ncbi:MAG: hypothetical protein KAJ11_05285 [Alphaproteobacteria bacterium]|jgi:hypothetical protein|nr:hypothetical protein [Alphaproteobacteria bacterium]
MIEDLTTEARDTAERVIAIFVDDRLKAMPLPEGFWEDDYVLGFLMCSALQLTQARHGDNLDPLAAADAAFQVLGEASGSGIEAVKDRVGVLQNSGSLDYLQAMKMADKLVRFISGSTTAALDPVILAAREQTRQMFADGSLDPDKVSEDAALRGILVNNLFTDVIRERFKIEAGA